MAYETQISTREIIEYAAKRIIAVNESVKGYTYVKIADRSHPWYYVKFFDADFELLGGIGFDYDHTERNTGCNSIW